MLTGAKKVTEDSLHPRHLSPSPLYNVSSHLLLGVLQGGKQEKKIL